MALQEDFNQIIDYAKGVSTEKESGNFSYILCTSPQSGAQFQKCA